MVYFFYWVITGRADRRSDGQTGRPIEQRTVKSGGRGFDSRRRVVWACGLAFPY